jgi:uncharacterized protein YndB with AHSA1/START domain
MLLTVAVVLLVVLAALATFIATRPGEFRISRSRTLAAPPEVVHAYVNDFNKWPEWSPWEKLDPTMKKQISGPPTGPGSSYHWAGNNKVGEGRMTILDSRPPESVTLRLEFMRPWKAVNTTQFDFARSGPGTSVTWAMTGTHNFMAKAFGMFMNMDKLVGTDFEKGLASLDAATAAAKPATR